MATVPVKDQELDHRALAEVFMWLGDIMDGFDQHAKDYAVGYWLFLTSDTPKPMAPTQLHPVLAKVIREQVIEQAHLDNAVRRFVR